jgi:hypothetical protein
VHYPALVLFNCPSSSATAVPQRPIIAVYHHVRRSYHPLKQQGKWLPTEDAQLKQYACITKISTCADYIIFHRAVADLGQQWEKVSQRVGRMSSDCRDRYRNHIINRDIRVNGMFIAPCALSILFIFYKDNGPSRKRSSSLES